MSLLGAVQTGDVDEVNDDGDAIYAAAQRFLTAVSEAGYANSRASSSWDYLPDVLRADVLTPALEPLMRPAQNLADDLLGSAEAIARAASAASDELRASYWDPYTEAITDTAKVTLGQGASIPVGGTPLDRLETQADALAHHLTGVQ